MVTIDTELIEKKRDERGRRITPRSEREALVRAYEQSGLTQKAFAQREGIKFPTFVSWLQELRRKRRFECPLDGSVETGATSPGLTFCW
jgi:transposase-like protein